MVAVSYTVEVTRSDGQWVGDVFGLNGAHSYARTLTQLRKEMDEVIRLVDDLPDEAPIEVVLDFRSVGGVIEEAAGAAARRRALKTELDAFDQWVQFAAEELLQEGLTVRDVAEVIDVSAGRVSQFAHTAPVIFLNKDDEGGEMFVLRLVSADGDSLTALSRGKLPQQVDVKGVVYEATGFASSANGGPLRHTYVLKETASSAPHTSR